MTSTMTARPAADAVAPDPDRNLALELVRATEAAAINCSRYLGFGDKNQVDAAAVDAMRPVLGTVRMNGVVVIGEGEKDEAPMLYNGERVGDGSGPEWDIAVDPVDGTTLTAKSLPDAVSVLGVSPRGTHVLPRPGRLHAEARGARCRGRRGRPRRPDRRHPGQDRRGHRPAVVRAHRGRARPRRGTPTWSPRSGPAGARIRFLLDGDVAGAIMAVTPGTGVDLLVGVGGTPEGVLAACALRCLGGEMFGRLIARDDAEQTAILDAGFDLDRILTTTDLVGGDNVFFAATGVTDGVAAAGRAVREAPDHHPLAVDAVPLRARSG